MYFFSFQGLNLHRQNGSFVVHTELFKLTFIVLILNVVLKKCYIDEKTKCIISHLSVCFFIHMKSALS